MAEQFKTYGNGKMVFELFPQEYLDLSAELRTEYHPKLAFLTGIPMDDIDMKLAQIAAYCEVMMDGDYTIEERTKLCKILLEKLIEKREYPDAQVILLPQ